jgi:hypothetical protein
MLVARRLERVCGLKRCPRARLGFDEDASDRHGRLDGPDEIAVMQRIRGEND